MYVYNMFKALRKKVSNNNWKSWIIEGLKSSSVMLILHCKAQIDTKQHILQLY